MIIFANFNGFINHSNKPSDLIWIEVRNELGAEIDNIIIKKNYITDLIKLKFGKRYRIELNNGNVISIEVVRKSIKCDVFRRYKNEIHFIGGKHQGKKDKDLSEAQLRYYCIWLLKNSYNEITIKNALQILKQIHGSVK